MKIKQLIAQKICKTLSWLLGIKGCTDYFIIGQAVIDLLDEAFDMGCTGKYEYHIFEDVDKWLGHFDDRKANYFANFLNDRFCCDITAEEILESRSIDSLANLINRHTGRFFPEKCKYCVDKCKK